MSNNTQELREMVDKLAGSGAHACYCDRSVDSGCKCALKDEYIDEIMNKFKSQTNQAVLEATKVTGETSDGYHTFNELYHYRMLYNALYVNELVKRNPYAVHKSKRHSDGELAFGGGWFVVTMDLPTGQVTNHYELKDWDKFHCAELDKAPEWDGHTPQEAAERMEATLRKELTQETKK